MNKTNRRNYGDSPVILSSLELLTGNLVTLVMRGSGIQMDAFQRRLIVSLLKTILIMPVWELILANFWCL